MYSSNVFNKTQVAHDGANIQDMSSFFDNNNNIFLELKIPNYLSPKCVDVCRSIQNVAIRDISNKINSIYAKHTYSKSAHV